MKCLNGLINQSKEKNADVETSAFSSERVQLTQDNVYQVSRRNHFCLYGYMDLILYTQLYGCCLFLKNQFKYNKIETAIEQVIVVMWNKA